MLAKGSIRAILPSRNASSDDRASSTSSDDVITRVDQLLDLDSVLVPRRQELGPEAADAVVPAVLLARQERVRGRDPLDLGIEDLSHLVEAALEVADVDALEGGEQPAHDLDVLLRHPPAQYRLCGAGACRRRSSVQQTSWAF